MSYAIDLNVLVLASNSEAVEHTAARSFLEQCAARPEVLCLAWPTVMGYLRITTHPSIFSNRPRTQHLEPTDYRRLSRRFQGENFARNLDLVRCALPFALIAISSAALASI